MSIERKNVALKVGPSFDRSENFIVWNAYKLMRQLPKETGVKALKADPRIRAIQTEAWTPFSHICFGTANNETLNMLRHFYGQKAFVYVTTHRRYDAILKANGFKFRKKVLGMQIKSSAGLRKNEFLPKGSFTVEHVQTAEQLKVWSEVYKAAREISPEVSPQVDAFAKGVLGITSCLLLLGNVDGKPAGSALLYLGKKPSPYEPATIFQLCALPLEESSRIQIALAFRCCEEARKRGVETVEYMVEEPNPIFCLLGDLVCNKEIYTWRSPSEAERSLPVAEHPTDGV